MNRRITHKFTSILAALTLGVSLFGCSSGTPSGPTDSPEKPAEEQAEEEEPEEPEAPRVEATLNLKDEDDRILINRTLSELCTSFSSESSFSGELDGPRAARLAILSLRLSGSDLLVDEGTGSDFAGCTVGQYSIPVDDLDAYARKQFGIGIDASSLQSAELFDYSLGTQNHFAAEGDRVSFMSVEPDGIPLSYATVTEMSEAGEGAYRISFVCGANGSFKDWGPERFSIENDATLGLPGNRKSGQGELVAKVVVDGDEKHLALQSLTYEGIDYEKPLWDTGNAGWSTDNGAAPYSIDGTIVRNRWACPYFEFRNSDSNYIMYWLDNEGDVALMRINHENYYIDVPASYLDSMIVQHPHAEQGAFWKNADGSYDQTIGAPPYDLPDGATDVKALWDGEYIEFSNGSTAVLDVHCESTDPQIGSFGYPPSQTLVTLGDAPSLPGWVVVAITNDESLLDFVHLR